MVNPYVAAQIAARRSPSVVKTKLLTLRSNYPNGLVFAVEGDVDKAVYSRWIARLRPNLSYEFLVLKGKLQVRQLKNSIARDLNGLSAGVKFLVDRDFDNLDGFHDAAHVFVLDRYSIENYLADPVTVGAALITAYPCDGFPHIRLQLQNLYRHDLDDFLVATNGLNRRIYIARRLGIAIDDFMPKGASAFAQVDLGNVVALATDPSTILPFELAVGVLVEDTLSAEFAELTPLLHHRGKFLLKFLNTWTSKLANEFRQGTLGLFGIIGPESGSILPEEFSPGSLASRSPLPAGLNAFLPDHE